MQGFLDHPDLELYKLYLERQLRYRKHTLSKKEEALLAASIGNRARAAKRVWHAGQCRS